MHVRNKRGISLSMTTQALNISFPLRQCVQETVRGGRGWVPWMWVHLASTLWPCRETVCLLGVIHGFENVQDGLPNRWVGNCPSAREAVQVLQEGKLLWILYCFLNIIYKSFQWSAQISLSSFLYITCYRLFKLISCQSRVMNLALLYV